MSRKDAQPDPEAGDGYGSIEPEAKTEPRPSRRRRLVLAAAVAAMVVFAAPVGTAFVAAFGETIGVQTGAAASDVAGKEEATGYETPIPRPWPAWTMAIGGFGNAVGLGGHSITISDSGNLTAVAREEMRQGGGFCTGIEDCLRKSYGATTSLWRKLGSSSILTSGASSWRDIFKYKTDAPDLPRDGDDGGDGGDADVSIPVETEPWQANCGETTSLRRKLGNCGDLGGRGDNLASDYNG